MDITASQLHISWQTVLLLKEIVYPNSTLDLLFVLIQQTKLLPKLKHKPLIFKSQRCWVGLAV